MPWWAEYKTSCQILSSVTQTLLCMLATSAASERMFSKAGDVITRKRNTLVLSKADNEFTYGESVTVASLLV